MAYWQSFRSRRPTNAEASANWLWRNLRDKRLCWDAIQSPKLFRKTRHPWACSPNWALKSTTSVTGWWRSRQKEFDKIKDLFICKCYFFCRFKLLKLISFSSWQKMYWLAIRKPHVRESNDLKRLHEEK